MSIIVNAVIDMYGMSSQLLGNSTLIFSSLFVSDSLMYRLVWKLLGRTIPGHINRLADFGVCLSCILPKKLLEEAPVGPNNAGSSGSSGYQVFGRPSERSDKKNDGVGSTTTAFSGTGYTASNNSDENSSRIPLLGSLRGNANSKKGDSLTDRREKARMAALARLDQGESDNDS